MSRITPADVPFSAGKARRFGLLVGGAFLILAALSAWRGRTLPVVAAVSGIGLTLVIGALIAPTRLATAYRAWMGIAKILGSIMTPLFMSVMYFVVLTPVAVIRRLVGGNPLVTRGSESFWVTRPVTRGRSMERQF